MRKKKNFFFSFLLYKIAVLKNQINSLFTEKIKQKEFVDMFLFQIYYILI